MFNATRAMAMRPTRMMMMRQSPQTFMRQTLQMRSPVPVRLHAPPAPYMQSANKLPEAGAHW
jgi:hypothetical protein